MNCWGCICMACMPFIICIWRLHHARPADLAAGQRLEQMLVGGLALVLLELRQEGLHRRPVAQRHIALKALELAVEWVWLRRLAALRSLRLLPPC